MDTAPILADIATQQTAGLAITGAVTLFIFALAVAKYIRRAK